MIAPLKAPLDTSAAEENETPLVAVRVCAAGEIEGEGAATIVTVTVAVAERAPFVAVIVWTRFEVSVGVPEITPVDPLMLRPEARSGAMLKVTVPGRFVATSAWLATTACPTIPFKVSVVGATLVFCVPEPVNKNLFTVPPGTEPRSIVFSIELAMRIDVNSPGVLYPFSNRSATAPAT